MTGTPKTPWEFRKINGQWHRRPTNTSEPWEILTVTKKDRSTFYRHKRLGNESTFRWDWSS